MLCKKHLNMGKSLCIKGKTFNVELTIELLHTAFFYDNISICGDMMMCLYNKGDIMDILKYALIIICLGTIGYLQYRITVKRAHRIMKSILKR